MSDSSKIVGLARGGRIALDDGALACVADDGTTLGRIYVGPNGKLVVDGIEILGVQKDDPWKLTGATSHDSENRAGFVLATGELRADGVVEETAFVKMGRAEDAAPGEHRGQIEVYLRASEDLDPQIVAVASSAYSQERAWVDVVPGARTVFVAAKYLLFDLWKFNTQPRPRGDRPPIEPPRPPSPPAGADYPPGTEAIAEGDFAALRLVYDVDLADEEGDYRAGRMPWAGPRTGFSVLWMAHRKAQSDHPA